jgi:hypothetical protein
MENCLLSKRIGRVAPSRASCKILAGGRGGGSGNRRQPVEIDHLYAVQIDDPLVYEAGFAFPNDFYFRPQIIQTNAGLKCIAAHADDAQVLQKALTTLTATPKIEFTERLGSPPDYTFRVTTIVLNPNTRKFKSQSVRDERSSSGIWYRGLLESESLVDMEGQERALTPRLALDDRGRLYFRAAKIGDAVAFLNCFFRPPAPRPAHMLQGSRHFSLEFAHGALMSIGPS